MKRKESNISAITFMWIGMLVTGLLLIISAIFNHYLDTQKVADVSLTLLMEEKFKEQDETGTELASTIDEIIEGNVQEQDGVALDTAAGVAQYNSTNVTDDSTQLLTEPNNTIEETEIANQSSKIDINTATSDQLQQLKGIGPSKAKAIIKDREQKGNYKNIADIKRVKGIGEKLYAGIQESIVAKP